MNLNQAPGVLSPEKNVPVNTLLANSVAQAVRYIESESVQVSPLTMFISNGRKFPIETEFQKKIAEIDRAAELAGEYVRSIEGNTSEAVDQRSLYYNEKGAKIVAEAYRQAAQLAHNLAAVNDVDPAAIAHVTELVRSLARVNSANGGAANDSRYAVAGNG